MRARDAVATAGNSGEAGGNGVRLPLSGILLKGVSDEEGATVAIPQKLHDVLAGGHNIWVATVGPDGTPNVSIKGSGSLLDDDRIVFADLYSRETLENLEHDPRVAIGVHDYARKVAMEIKGHAEIVDHGELVDEMKQRLGGGEREVETAAGQACSDRHGRLRGGPVARGRMPASRSGSPRRARPDAAARAGAGPAGSVGPYRRRARRERRSYRSPSASTCRVRPS